MLLFSLKDKQFISEWIETMKLKIDDSNLRTNLLCICLDSYWDCDFFNSFIMVFLKILKQQKSEENQRY